MNKVIFLLSAGRLFVLVSMVFIYGCAAPASNPEHSGKIFEYADGVQSRWSSPENPDGEKGAGAKTNNGAKGRPKIDIEAGQTVSLLDIQGQGIINRIWITINDRSPEMLRSLKLEMFWDNEEKPAVSAPLGDFFGMTLGITSAFQNDFFASPEGKSFNCFIPMPFKKAAKIRIVNESGKRLSHCFFDVDYNLLKTWNANYLYFHCSWSRNPATTLAEDFEVLPRISGKGRFLGMSVGINVNTTYKKTWWGEGEVKMFIDGDDQRPTLVGTGTEDYIGTGWGQGVFANRYTGCLVADGDHEQWSYYRFHIPDPVYFSTDCRVTLQQIGGGPLDEVRNLQQSGVKLIPVTIDATDTGGQMIPLYKKDRITNLSDTSFPAKWTNFYRSDDISATAYFYLSTPSNNLPPLLPAVSRTVALRSPAELQKAQ